jgi:D-glycero-D-manno-heptose 1,7-bisphosphate phosphatase
MKLIILGRDGVINQIADTYISSPEQWIPIQGSLEAIAQLTRGGYRIIIVTNQPGIGEGVFDIQALNAVHEKMYQQLTILGGQIESILFCPHTAQQACDCRKPHAGLLLDLQNRLNITLTNVPLVGDSIDDVQAAQELGAAPVLVRTGKGEVTVANATGLDQVPVYKNLAEFAEHLLPGI